MTASLASSLTTSLADRDRDGFLTAFASDAPTRRLGARWYDNLAQFDDVSFAASGTALNVTSAVPGDSSPATQTVAVDVATTDGRAVITGLELHDDTPDWATSDKTVLTSPSGSVIIGATATVGQRDSVADALDAAVTTLKATGLGTLDDAWNHRLVLDVPQDAVEYAHEGGDPQANEAVTSCAGGPARVVVNPAALDYPADQLGPLVLHEAVHAATRACTASYPAWVVEGLAESVTASAYATVARDNQALAASYVAEHGLPAKLPQARDFTREPSSQRAFYALAQVAVDAAADHLGRDQAVDLLAGFPPADATEPAPDEARVTTWYRAALRALR